jgi:hypothetical protein
MRRGVGGEVRDKGRDRRLCRSVAYWSGCGDMSVDSGCLHVCIISFSS